MADSYVERGEGPGWSCAPVLLFGYEVMAECRGTCHLLRILLYGNGGCGKSAFHSVWDGKKFAPPYSSGGGVAPESRTISVGDTSLKICLVPGTR